VQKNREGHLIVLYDEEERVSCATATQFIEKGFLNVYVLSGGTSRFPHWWCFSL
jgi:rhodanese-related sulfurtransferase